MVFESIMQKLFLVSNLEKSILLQRFFKTGEGQYAEGDIFIGITIHQIRSIIKNRFKLLSLNDIQKMMYSPYHEIRLSGLLCLVKLFIKATNKRQLEILNFYLDNADQVNNWDLVDLSCPIIVGHYLLKNEFYRSILLELSESENLWKQRMSIVSTLTLIKHNNFDNTLILAEKMLNHPHDLIRKAIGWVLREIGKRDKKVLVMFLSKYSTHMPRIELRYAIEHFSLSEKKYWMNY